MATYFHNLLDLLLAPPDLLFDPARRLFWPFFAGSGVVALFVVTLQGVKWRDAFRRGLSRRLWGHRSVLADFRLIFAKALLTSTLFGSLGFSSLAIAAMATRWLRHHTGNWQPWSLSPVWVGLIFTVAVFLVEDWSRFLVHRWMHRNSWLWEFHKVHHSAEVLTPFTLYRTHPVEVLLNGMRGALTVGLVTAATAIVFGPHIRAWEILGVDAIGFLWSVGGANLRHSHVWVSYGRAVEHVLISPAQHQVHHSRSPEHYDQNFGTVLSFWDWLGGSLYTTSQTAEKIEFGLPAEEKLSHSLGDLLIGPFARTVKRAATVARHWSKISWESALAKVAFLLLLSFVAGCSGAPRLDRSKLLQSLGSCTLQTYGQAKTTTSALASKVTAWSTSVTDENRSMAQAAWRSTMDAWQLAELHFYGPAADFETVGGMGLRTGVYGWPDVNRCLIERQLVSKAYETNFANLSTSTIGLGSLEYLLFYTGNDNACASTEEINSEGTWAALSAGELTARKAKYAAAVAADVDGRVQKLIAAWEAGGFSNQLTSAGKGSTLFTTQQEAISAVGEALFTLDLDIKDRKIAQPLGILNCAQSSCPDDVESPWANYSRQNLENNMRGVRTMIFGCAESDLAFDDLLIAAGAATVVPQLRTDITAVEDSLNSLAGISLKDAVTMQKAKVAQLHSAVQEITSFLKMEFTLTLQISPRRVEGDHD